MNKEELEQEIFEITKGYRRVTAGTSETVWNIDNAILSLITKSNLELVEALIHVLKYHNEGESYFCDTGEDMDWYCRSSCMELAIDRINQKLKQEIKGESK